MPTAAERLERIARMRELPARVEAAVSDLGEEQLDAPGGEGEWSVRQVVHHLADAHMNLLVRIKLALTEEKPTLKPYDQEAWAKLSDTTQLPLQPSLSILRGVHQRAGVLLQSLPESAWHRSAIHPESGVLTVEDLLATFVRHGDAHLEQIGRIRAVNSW